VRLEHWRGAFGAFKVRLEHSRDRLIDKISIWKKLKSHFSNRCVWSIHVTDLSIRSLSGKLKSHFSNRCVWSMQGAFGACKVRLEHARCVWSMQGAFGACKVRLEHLRDRLIDKISIWKKLKSHFSNRCVWSIHVTGLSMRSLSGKS
jgi:hypothetical protein